MKNFLVFSFSVLFLSSLVFVSAIQAAPQINDLTNAVAHNAGYDTGNENLGLSQGVGRIVRITLGLVGTIFFALTVYAGFLWMMASGNDEQVTKAQNILRRAIIGLIIALSAYSVSVFVTSQVLSYSTAKPAVGQTATLAASSTEGFWAGFAQGASNWWNMITQ